MEIVKMSAVDETYRQQVVAIFVEGFYREMKSLSKDKEKLMNAFEHSFVSDAYLLAVENEQVLGILACSTDKKRALKFDKQVLKKYFGWIKGSVGYKMLAQSFEKPLTYGQNAIYIESVATAPLARGKGVATALFSYVFNHMNADRLVLEVVDYNEGARRLYERLGFVEFERKYMKYPKLVGYKYGTFMERFNRK